MKTGFIVWLLAVTLSTTESVSDGFCVLSEKTDGQSNKMTRFLLKQSTQNEVTDDALISVSELTEEPCINNSTVEYRLEPSDLLVLKFEGTFQQLNSTSTAANVNVKYNRNAILENLLVYGT
ncbi:hypothetical protein MAR_025665 [Mya arenaria]|uniref:Uncharacterized protein n=1 Tax=Mya arenaria TaxID=6604 RepID=A0ABY7EQF5_MYAAR|nr:hypothetical protein MAR_025665 [Mya arenaria]